MPKNNAPRKAGTSQAKFDGKEEAAGSFEILYPSLTEWTKNRGLLEIGYNDFSCSFVRVFDIGGTFWEGKNPL